MSVYGVKANKCLEEVPSNDDLGTASKFGLCKTINDFNAPTGDQSGRALAASAGYQLAQQILIMQRVTTDSGWIDAEMSSGVSAISTGSQIQYRKIGNHVFVRGLVTFTMGSAALNLAALPADYRPQKNTYIYSPCQGARIAQIFVNSSGALSCDYIINLADGSTYTGEIGWAQTVIDYFID